MNNHMNIAIITLDSLRYDVAAEANTPKFRRLIEKAGVPNWVRVGCHGTYTLPSHVALFTNGYLPNRNEPEVPGPYNSNKQRLFRVDITIESHPNVLYPTSPEYPNIVKGFEAQGYRTVGVGGVNWFRLDMATSRLWKDEYFSEFWWNFEFIESNRASFENQISVIEGLELGRQLPIFFFLNVASTHFPYRNPEVDRRVAEPRREDQIAALEYVDYHLSSLLDLLPRPVHLIFFGDHGDCFGEDGKWDHGFYHPKVMEVPMLSVILE